MHDEAPFLYFLPQAIADIFWSFLPVYVVVLVLWLAGGLEHFSERSDLLLASSLVFADSARRLYSEGSGWMFWRPSLQPTPTTGVLGALIAVILISLILLSESGEVTKLREVVASSRFQVTEWVLFSLSLLYGVRVRMALLRHLC